MRIEVPHNPGVYAINIYDVSFKINFFTYGDGVGGYYNEEIGWATDGGVTGSTITADIGNWASGASTGIESVVNNLGARDTNATTLTSFTTNFQPGIYERGIAAYAGDTFEFNLNGFDADTQCRLTFGMLISNSAWRGIGTMSITNGSGTFSEALDLPFKNIPVELEYEVTTNSSGELKIRIDSDDGGPTNTLVLAGLFVEYIITVESVFPSVLRNSGGTMLRNSGGAVLKNAFTVSVSASASVLRNGGGDVLRNGGGIILRN